MNKATLTESNKEDFYFLFVPLDPNLPSSIVKTVDNIIAYENSLKFSYIYRFNSKFSDMVVVHDLKEGYSLFSDIQIWNTNYKIFDKSSHLRQQYDMHLINKSINELNEDEIKNPEIQLLMKIFKGV